MALTCENVEKAVWKQGALKSSLVPGKWASFKLSNRKQAVHLTLQKSVKFILG